jgi:transcriptional regulator with PAS, ATPase and Fis domain
MLAPNLNRHFKTFSRLNSSDQQLKVSHSQQSKHPYLLQAIVEGFVDGVLILTAQGECIHANQRARRICHHFSSEQLHCNSVPLPIWRICESLMESRELFPQQKMIIEAEIDTNQASSLRVRVRWLEFSENDSLYLLVTIEDRNQSTQNSTVTEAKKYNLTPREAQVWSLRRANYSYKDIAAKLYITTNTVKKHLKNVYAKQQESIWSEADRAIS